MSEKPSASAQDAIPAAQTGEQQGSELGRDGVPNLDAVQRGRTIGEELGWDISKATNYTKDFGDFTAEHLLSGVYGRGGLTPRERELVIIAIIVTQGSAAGLNWHFREVAHRLGISERNIREVLYTSCFYAGWPKGSQAFNELGAVLNGPNTWPEHLLMKNDESPQ